MKYLLSLIIILWFSASSLSCGYTTLQKSQDSDDTMKLLPDLIIVGISQRYDTNIWADDPDTTPSYFFRAKVVNIGEAPFQGSFVLAWADNPADINRGEFPNLENVRFPNDQLAPSDSAIIEVSARHRQYVSGMLIRFVLATQSVMPGNFCYTYFPIMPIAEMRYDNNVYDYNFP